MFGPDICGTSTKRVHAIFYSKHADDNLLIKKEVRAETDQLSHEDLEYVGIELWQVKAGTIFDNIIITDDITEAEALLESTFEANKADEKQMFDDAEEAKRKKEEEERKAREAAESEDEDDDEDDDDDDFDDDDDEDDKEEL